MTLPRLPLRIAALALGLGLATPAFAACDVTPTLSDDLGSYSPAALKAGAAPYIAGTGGFGCTSSAVIVLLSTNYLRATVPSGTALTLTNAGGGTVTYRLAAAADGTSPIVPGTATYYINGTTVNLLGTLPAGAVSTSIYAKPSSTATLAPGIYTGSVPIRWDWYFCSAIGALNACVGTVDSGSKTATVTLTLAVAARPATITISSVTTWDPVSGTSSPKALPGSKRRTALTIANPDIVPIDLNTLALALPTAPSTAVALDGDGTSDTSVVRFTQGSTSSTLTLNYAAPASTTDDVDFSSDNGATWTYQPAAGDTVSQGAVTTVRFRPQGSMAPQSSATISIPYRVK